jgi:glycerol-3-phosphate dehydrogenase
LPGGVLAGGSTETAAAALRSAYPWLDPITADRLIRRYGSEAAAMLGEAGRAQDLGEAFGAGLTAREVDWLRREEWAESADDILWRRTKLGLRLDAADRARLEDYLARCTA